MQRPAMVGGSLAVNRHLEVKGTAAINKGRKELGGGQGWSGGKVNDKKKGSNRATEYLNTE